MGRPLSAVFRIGWRGVSVPSPVSRAWPVIQTDFAGWKDSDPVGIPSFVGPVDWSVGEIAPLRYAYGGVMWGARRRRGFSPLPYVYRPLRYGRPDARAAQYAFRIARRSGEIVGAELFLRPCAYRRQASGGDVGRNFTPRMQVNSPIARRFRPGLPEFTAALKTTYPNTDRVDIRGPNRE